MDPKGNVAIITRAGSGLGLAACKILAEAGANVYGFERDSSSLERIKRAAPGVLARMVVDVSSDRNVRDAIAKVVAPGPAQCTSR